MSKYYTPLLSEFYYGFEYELNVAHYDDREEWIELLWKDSDSISQLSDIRETRVKYLNQEDIESLGFSMNKVRSNDKYQYYFMSDDECVYELKYSFGEESYWLDKGPQVIIQAGGVQRLNARVKSKSELEKVLSMIGYE